MILTFGYLCMEIRSELKSPLTPNTTHQTTHCNLSIGGSAALQSISAARAGARVNLCGTIGSDLFGTKIIEALRREGIQTTALGENEDLETGLIQSIIDTHQGHTQITAAGANIASTPNQITETWLSEKTLLMLQNDIPVEENIELLIKAKNLKARTLMNFAHNNNVEESLFEHLDLCIIKGNIETPYAKTKIVVHNTGAVTAHIDKKEIEFERRTKATDPSATFDCFCGTFAACTQAGLAIEKSIAYAQSAMHLCAQKKGSYTALPRLDDIEEKIKEDA